jgi:hypothetical protein
LIDLTPQFIQASFFIGFFFMLAVALTFNKVKLVRVGFGCIFTVAFLLAGLTGRSYWPFFSWHLFGIVQTQDLSFYEFRVQDSLGNEIKYDARAIAPSLATPLRRLAAEFPNLPPNDKVEVGRFLLSSAIDYQRIVLKDDVSILDMLKFPPHQIGFAWTVENISELGPIVSLVVYKVEARFSADGTQIETFEKELIEQFSNLNQTSSTNPNLDD